MLRITDTVFIDDKELEESFIRASGPGGQSVNKTSSAVQLRFNLNACRVLQSDVKARARRLAGNRLTKDGWIVIHAETFRTQKANREDARKRLASLLRAAIPRPTIRKKTRPSKSAVERRLQSKKKRSIIKSNRIKSNRKGRFEND